MAVARTSSSQRAAEPNCVGERLRDITRRFAIAAEILEVVLVQEDRVRIRQLALAQRRHLEARRVLRDLVELELDGVEVLHRAGVVVVVVRGQKLLGQSRQLRRIERQGCDLVGARLRWCERRGWSCLPRFRKP